MIKSCELPTYILLLFTAIVDHIKTKFEKLGLAAPRFNSLLVPRLPHYSSNKHDASSNLLLNDLAFESNPSFEVYFTLEPNDKRVMTQFTGVKGIDSSSADGVKKNVGSDETKRFERESDASHEKLDDRPHVKKPRLMYKIRNRIRRKEEIHKLQRDSFRPRRSGRVSKLYGDGDTWIECLVVNSTNQKHKTKRSRSLFYSIKTQIAFWDEPPSGASNVIYRDRCAGLEM